MNLEEKAEYIYQHYSIYDKDVAKDGFYEGYRECLSDLKDFIKANPKITADKITEYLNSL